MSHSFARGSAIFEVLSLHETAAGPAVFRLDEHIDRLFRSAGLLEMELPLNVEAFHEAVLDTVRRNGIKQGSIKIVCFCPQIALEILLPQKMLDVSIFVVDLSQDLGMRPFPFERGTTACVSKWRKLDPSTVPVEAKVAANYLNGMIARLEGKKWGFEEVIMLDTQGFIAEGGTESVFLVREGKLMTPALGTVLDSITRRSVLQVAAHLGIETVEARLRPELLYEAEEIFFSGTPIKVLAVRRIGERELDEVPGPLTRRLSAFMGEIVSGQEEQFKGWLFPVG